MNECLCIHFLTHTTPQADTFQVTPACRLSVARDTETRRFRRPGPASSRPPQAQIRLANRCTFPGRRKVRFLLPPPPYPAAASHMRRAKDADKDRDAEAGVEAAAVATGVGGDR